MRTSWLLLTVASSLVVAAGVFACSSDTVGPPPAPPVNWGSLEPKVKADAGPAAPTASELRIAKQYAQALGAAGFASLAGHFDEEAHFSFPGWEDVHGPAAVIRAHELLFGAFDDRSVAVSRLFRTPSQQALDWTITATQAREWLGIPPSHRPVTIHGFTVLSTTDEGKISDVHVYFDAAFVKAQLGDGPKELRAALGMPVAGGPAAASHGEKRATGGGRSDAGADAGHGDASILASFDGGASTAAARTDAGPGADSGSAARISALMAIDVGASSGGNGASGSNGASGGNGADSGAGDVPGSPQVIDQTGAPEEMNAVMLARGALDALEDNHESSYADLMSDDVEIFGLERPQPARGKAEVHAYFKAMRKAIGQLDTTVTNAFGAQQYAVVEYTIAGEQLGPIQWIPPQRDKAVRFHLVDVVEEQAGKIRRIWRFGNPEEVLAPSPD